MSNSFSPNQLEELREFGGMPLAERVAKEFLRECTSMIDTLEKAVQSGDASAIKKAAHRLKGASASVGATKASSMASSLEVRASKGSVEGADASVGELSTELQRAQDAIATFIKSWSVQ
jgi:HPt (histidine-containing phosphotransfer) domain-containing protein